MSMEPVPFGGVSPGNMLATDFVPYCWTNVLREERAEEVFDRPDPAVSGFNFTMTLPGIERLFSRVFITTPANEAFCGCLACGDRFVAPNPMAPESRSATTVMEDRIGIIECVLLRASRGGISYLEVNNISAQSKLV